MWQLSEQKEDSQVACDSHRRIPNRSGFVTSSVEEEGNKNTSF